MLAVDFEEVTPTSPMYFLLPIKKNMETEFGQGFPVEELFIKRLLEYVPKEILSPTKPTFLILKISSKTLSS